MAAINVYVNLDILEKIVKMILTNVKSLHYVKMAALVLMGLEAMNAYVVHILLVHIAKKMSMSVCGLLVLAMNYVKTFMAPIHVIVLMDIMERNVR